MFGAASKPVRWPVGDKEGRALSEKGLSLQPPCLARRVAGGSGKDALVRGDVRLRLPCAVRRLASESGQGTLEYALVMFGFLSIIAGLGALWNMLDGGLLVSHALASASHHVQAVTPGAVADVFAF